LCLLVRCVLAVLSPLCLSVGSPGCLAGWVNGIRCEPPTDRLPLTDAYTQTNSSGDWHSDKRYLRSRPLLFGLSSVPPLPLPTAVTVAMPRTRVLQHHYNARTQKWLKVQSEVEIDEQPFAEGAFRLAYHATMPWNGQERVSVVCKFARDLAGTPRATYFADVEAHEVAALYADAFNAALPAKFPRIEYVNACILELVDRPGRPVCGCEQQLVGRFRKYNNNVGAVCAQPPATNAAAIAEEAAEARARAAAGLPPLENWDPTATAQAFSHFSFAHSGSSVLICDIQGVANQFTDPQIHTLSGKGFGLGNLGQTGIRAFMLRHQCTELCRACGLAPIAAKDLNEKAIPPSFGTGNNAAAAAATATGAQQSGQQQQQQQPRGMFSSASTANLPQRGMPGASSTRVAGRAGGHSASSQRSLPQYDSFRNESPAASPASSPRASQHQPLQLQPAQQQEQQQPPPPVAAVPVVATTPPPPAKPLGLDDSDEALMNMLMGDG